MSGFKDLKGNRFGRLTVGNCIGKDEHGRYLWECVCDCGNRVVRSSASFRPSRITMSCGCLGVEARKAAAKKNFKHGHDYTSRIYRIWKGMRERCYKPYCKDFVRYGGRGISVCDEWLYSFENFKSWADTAGYSDGLTLDRIDVNGRYSPDNCRWVTLETQENNRRNNLHIYGQSYRRWFDLRLDETLKYTSFISRVRRGWTLTKALCTPTKGGEL